MLLEDVPALTVAVVIPVSSVEVWPLVCDPSTPIATSGELESVNWLDGAAGPELGARFQGRNRRPEFGTWTTVSTITCLEPLKVLQWTVGSPAEPVSVWTYRLAEHRGGTKLSQTCLLGRGSSFLTQLIDERHAPEAELVEFRLLDHGRSMARNLSHISKSLQG